MRFILALLILSFVVFFHELGHFLLAKANGITVLEFAIGMGPRILSFKRKGTVYAWRLFPFGGMCSMLGEDDEEDGEGSFNHASAWRRILVVAAGPVFNFILAFILALIVIGIAGADQARVTKVDEGSPAYEAGLKEGDLILSYEGNGIANARELYTDLSIDGVPTDEINMKVRRGGEKIRISYKPKKTTKYLLGFSYTVNKDPVEITQLTNKGPLYEAGVRPGDVITAINGTKLSNSRALQDYLEKNPLDGSELKLTLDRKGKEIEISVTPRESTIATLDFVFNLAREKVGFLSGLKYGIGEIGYWIHVTFRSIGGLLTGFFSPKDLSGPVGIVSAIGDVYEEARDFGVVEIILSMINMAILLTANLGVMNLLPLPALDGGRLVFLILEAVRGKPVNRKFEGYVHFIGLAALMALMLFVCYNDIAKLF